MSMLSCLDISTRPILFPRRLFSVTNSRFVANMLPVSLNALGKYCLFTLSLYNGKYFLFSSSYPQLKCLSSTTLIIVSYNSLSSFGFNNVSIAKSKVFVLRSGEVGCTVITTSYFSFSFFSF